METALRWNVWWKCYCFIITPVIPVKCRLLSVSQLIFSSAASLLNHSHFSNTQWLFSTHCVLREKIHWLRLENLQSRGLWVLNAADKSTLKLFVDKSTSHWRIILMLFPSPVLSCDTGFVWIKGMISSTQALLFRQIKLTSYSLLSQANAPEDSFVSIALVYVDGTYNHEAVTL